jgi:hypothetical protein
MTRIVWSSTVGAVLGGSVGYVTYLFAVRLFVCHDTLWQAACAGPFWLWFLIRGAAIGVVVGIIIGLALARVVEPREK